MDAGSLAASGAAPRLTWVEICARFPGEWVSLIEADWVDDDYLDFRTAVVVKHSASYPDSFPEPDARWGTDEMMVHDFTGPIRPARPLYLR